MLVQSMQSALFSAEDYNHFAADLHDYSFDGDSLPGLQTTWLADDHNLPLTDEVTNASASTEKSSGQSIVMNSRPKEALDEQTTLLLDTALDFTFDTELLPFTDATVTMSPLKRQQSKHSQASKVTTFPLKRVVPDSTPRHGSGTESGRASKNAPLLGNSSRPKTRGSAWLEQEQNTFFSMFKVKWPPALEGGSKPTLSSLLLQRFDAISTKIRTKSVMEVRQFYTIVMHNVSELLRNVENDINLTNPDQVRIAIWCWRKLMLNQTHFKEFESLNAEASPVKLKLANLLLQSIIRSRRQMRKAKSDLKNTPAPGLTSISTWVARSNLSTFSSQFSASAQKEQIHYPMVRKKQKRVATVTSAVTENVKKALSSVQQPGCDSPGRVTLKRQRTTVSDSSPTVKKTCRIGTNTMAITNRAPMHDEFQSCTQNGVAISTPQQCRKKLYIKMRMIPRDMQTRADVVRCGCRPKVELKLSSTKKISEITAHMSTKWANVHSFVAKGSVLCFYEKDGTGNRPFEDSSLTCFDIWKLCGKYSNGENVVEVSYMWQPSVKNYKSDQDQHSMPLRAPPELFDDMLTAAGSGDECETLQLSPACDLQDFGDQVAFDRSMIEDARMEAAALESLLLESQDKDIQKEYSPITGRLRRRIQPVLIVKEEFNI